MNFHIKLTKIIKERNHFNVLTYFLDIHPHSVFFFQYENVKKATLICNNYFVIN